MPRPKRVETTPETELMARSAFQHGERSDCAVRSVALVCGVSYEEAHKALADAGRKDCDGTYFADTEKALKHFGFKVVRLSNEDIKNIISQYPGHHAHALKSITSYHPARFNSVWKNGKKYLMRTNSHILAIIDGTAHDWSAGSALRCSWLYEVVKVD